MMHARIKFQHVNNSLESNLVRRAALIFLTLLLAAILPFVSGCGKNKDAENVDESVAVTPLSSPSNACASGTTYRGNDWAQVPHARANIVPYGFGVPDYQPNAHVIADQGYCGCPQGTQAMCDTSYGVVCMPTGHLANQNVQWFHQTSQGFQHSGFGAYTGYTNIFDPRTNLPPPTHFGHFRRPPSHPQPGYPNGGYRRGRNQTSASLSCSTQIGQTCTVGVNSCGQGAYCRPVAQGYSIGICAQ